MINVEATAAFADLEHSNVSKPSNSVARTPNQTGTYTHTSFSDMSLPTNPSILQMSTDVICMPGYIVVPTGRPRGYQLMWSNHVKNLPQPFAARYSVAR